MTVVTRFAPSPTGRLHVGNLRTALHNWLLAKHAGGQFLLRIDDTDAERSREEYVEAIRADLAWLGVHPDGEERQSARFALYETEFARLAEQGRVYRCYETPQELELKRKVLLGRGLPPIYDRAALTLTDADHAEKAAAGEKPHWRFLLDRDAPIEWQDGVRGPQHFEPAQMSDPVIRRADGSWLYMLPSVIDDIAMGITDVLRGEDHVSNTATQMQMFTALGAGPPRFAHEALLVGSEGKLSKRLGSLGIDTLRETGVEVEETARGLKVRRAPGTRVRAVDVETAVFPGFPTDLQAQMMALLCTADGVSRLHETIFENRFMHAPELTRMGAEIDVQGGTATVTGMPRLKGAPVMATDLRASVSLILAGLAAEGETVVNRVYHLDRGYEHVVRKLRGVGAVIERVKD